MKRHGRWRFFREARAARRIYKDHAASARWWIPEEEYKIYRLLELMRSGYGRAESYSNAAAIIRCARRYARRFGGITRVKHWNSICLTIAERSGFDHHMTLKRCMFYGEDALPNSLLRWDSKWNADRDTSLDRPHVVANTAQIYERAKNIGQIRRERLERERLVAAKQRSKAWDQVFAAQNDLRLINAAIKSAQQAQRNRP